MSRRLESGSHIINDLFLARIINATKSPELSFSKIAAGILTMDEIRRIRLSWKKKLLPKTGRMMLDQYSIVVLHLGEAPATPPHVTRKILEYEIRKQDSRWFFLINAAGEERPGHDECGIVQEDVEDEIIDYEDDGIGLGALFG